MKAMSREELLGLDAATNLATLARALGISEPVARERHRCGDFEAMGIRVVRLGAQWRVVTEDILRALGISRDGSGAGPASDPPSGGPLK